MIAGKLAKLSSRERNGLVIGVVFLALLGLDWMIVEPVVRQSSRLGEGVAQARKDLRDKLAVRQWKPSVAKDFKDVEGLLRKATSQSEEIANMKGEIDDLAHKTSLTVSSMEHRAPKPTEYYDEYIVDIAKFESDRRGFLDFLDELQNSPSMLRVSTMSITPGTNPDQIRGSMTITKVMLSDGSLPAAAPGGAKEAAPKGA
jgi:type II secretory pathway component PulM